MTRVPEQRVGIDGKHYACHLLLDLEGGERQENAGYLAFGLDRFKLVARIERRKGKKKVKENLDFHFIVSKLPRWLLGFAAWFRVSTDGAIFVSRRDIKCMSDALPFTIRIRTPGPLDLIIYVEVTDGSVQWSEFARVVFSE